MIVNNMPYFMYWGSIPHAIEEVDGRISEKGTQLRECYASWCITCLMIYLVCRDRWMHLEK